MKKTPIVLLHGWGLSGSLFDSLSTILKKQGFSVYAPDLPGFGRQPLVSSTMDLEAYVEFVKQFLEKEKIKKAVLVGHSFGGRIALKFAWQYPDMVEKLILTGAPIIRHRPLGKRLIGMVATGTSSTLALVPTRQRAFLRKALYHVLGEWDYYKSGALREVFKQIIVEDLQQYARGVTTPTLLVWGEHDKTTPTSYLPRVVKLFPHAQSIVLPNTGHTPFRNHAKDYYEAIKTFL